jgi:hypothetical protein
VIEVDDLDATIAKLRDAGARFRNDPIAGPGRPAGARRGPVGQPGRAVRGHVRLMAASTDLGALLARVAIGDRSSFRRLVRRHRPRLCSASRYVS